MVARAQDYVGAYRQYHRLIERRMEAAALLATDASSQDSKRVIRGEMARAGLGRLGYAVDASSDLSRGRGVHRRPGGGWSASGVVFVRSKSERTLGAIESYMQGAEIVPVRSRWLWFATDAIPRVTGRFRMTPALWVKNGWDRKIGPLVQIRGPRGTPLLIVRNVGIAATGGRRSAKSLTKKGLPRKGQVKADFIVAFIGLPRTSRAARVNVPTIMRLGQQQLGRLYHEALERTAR